MPRNREYFSNGVRDYYSKKDKHSCLDCKHCDRSRGSLGYVYTCQVISRNNSLEKRNFPYDNTACKDFQE